MLFPAQAGMTPTTKPQPIERLAIPRAGGDDPTPEGFARAFYQANCEIAMKS